MTCQGRSRRNAGRAAAAAAGREASENSTSTRVTSASPLTSSGAGVTLSTASGPWVSSTPARTKMIGPVTSNRSSRADKVPHANTSAAMIARSDSLITLARFPEGRRVRAAEHQAAQAG